MNFEHPAKPLVYAGTGLGLRLPDGLGRHDFNPFGVALVLPNVRTGYKPTGVRSNLL